MYLGVFCGLRTWYNDTVTYIQIYDQTPTLANFLKENTYTYAQGIGFAFVNSILKTLRFSTQDYLMFYAVITVSCYVGFIRKYCDDIIAATFLMFTTGFYTFALAAIKQCLAMAICLVALQFLIKKKHVLYILLVGLASLFHPYALVYLLLLLMDFRPLSWRTYFYIAFFVIIGFALDKILGTIVDVTAMIGANYSMDSFIGEGVNIFRVLVCFVPIALMFIYGKRLFIESTRQENILFNMTMLNALIMFVGLFGTANYFARTANYFLPAQVVMLPWLLKRIGGKDKLILAFFCFIGYTGYFIYGNAFQNVFDDTLSQVSIWTYISSHFGA
jgi:hypothetical protein